MPRPLEYDVTIVGAGLAGLQVAVPLARAGARVLLVDARRRVGERVRTTGIFVRRSFESFPELHPFLGPPIRTVGLHSPRGRSLEIEAARDEFRVGRMRDLLEARLEEAVAEGAEWRARTAYASLRREGPGLRVRFREGEEVRTRFLVGADGARSRVARDLGLDRNTRWIAGVENLHPTASPRRPRLDCWVDPSVAPGYLAWVADDGEEMHVGVGGSGPGFDPAGALRVFEERLRREGRVPDATLIERRGGLIPVNGILPRIGCDRGLLVGDAAGAVSPLTAGGLDACMRLSAHAAEVLLRALEEPAAIGAYSGGEYRTRFASRLAMRRTFDVLARRAALVELGFALARTRIAGAAIRHVFFARRSFPDRPEERPAATAAAGAFTSES